MVSWSAHRQSEGSGFKFRSGQISYVHGVKTRLSTLGLVMFLVVRTPLGLFLTKFGGHKRTTGEAGIVTTGVFRELDWD